MTSGGRHHQHPAISDARGQDIPTGFDVMEQNNLPAQRWLHLQITDEERECTHPAKSDDTRWSPIPSWSTPRRFKLCFAWSYAQICDVERMIPRNVVAPTPRYNAPTPPFTDAAVAGASAGPAVRTDAVTAGAACAPSRQTAAKAANVLR